MFFSAAPKFAKRFNEGKRRGNDAMTALFLFDFAFWNQNNVTNVSFPKKNTKII